MKKSFLIKVNIFIMSILLTVVLSIVPNYSYFLSYYPAKNISTRTVLVTGDSYAGYFATYECLQDYNILIYADAGKTTRENYDMMKEAINTFPDVVIISIGVNDHSKHISPLEFKYRMEDLVSECKGMNKKVILHTYMNYDTEAFSDAFGDAKKVFEISEYDNALKDVAKKYSNAFYIDMSDYNDEKYLMIDRIHYNKVFYDELYNRISTALLII